MKVGFMKAPVIRPITKHTRKHTTGVSLVEVMVAIVLSAVALLALAGMNAATVRYTKMSQYRATATLLATDLSERVRANRAGIDGYSFSSGADPSFSGQKDAISLTDSERCNLALAAAPPPATPAPCPPPSDLAAAELAALDFKHWRVLVRDQLPQGSVYVSRDTAAPTAMNLWVAWRDPNLRPNEAPRRPTSSSGDSAQRTECPAGLALDATADADVRCIYFRIAV